MTQRPHLLGSTDHAQAQRAHRGFADEDTFSFDTYLAGVIAEGVRTLAARATGVPTRLATADDEAALEDAAATWAGILDELASGFEAYVAADGDPRREEDPRFVRSMALFVEWFPHLWD